MTDELPPHMLTKSILPLRKRTRPSNRKPCAACDGTGVQTLPTGAIRCQKCLGHGYMVHAKKRKKK